MLFSRSVWSLYTIGDKRSVALLKKAVLVPKKKSITNPTDINETLLPISKVRICFYSGRPCIEYFFFCFCPKLISMKTTDNSKIIALNYDSITSSKKSWVNVFIFLMLFLFSSSYLRMFFETRVLKNFANLPRKHLCWKPILTKLQLLSPASWSKKTSKHVLFCEIFEVFKNTFFLQNTSGGSV